MTIAKLWRSLPVAVRAVAAGSAVAAAGTLPWAALASANTRYGSAVPWAVPITAGYLWLYWRYFVRGWGWPRATADARRRDARANRVPDELWGAAVPAGMIGLFAGGRSEWQILAAPAPLIWENGPDAAFWGSLAAFVAAGALAVWSFSALGSAARAARGSSAEPT